MVSADETERRIRIAMQVANGARDLSLPYYRAPRGVWLAARTSTRQPYPCRCNQYGACSQICPCRGRHDRRPERHCCARLHQRATGATP